MTTDLTFMKTDGLGIRTDILVTFNVFLLQNRLKPRVGELRRDQGPVYLPERS